MTIVFGWCGTTVKSGEPDSGTSHGMCVKCYAGTAGLPIEDISQVPREVYDNLPYGMIRIDSAGNILDYNETESRIAGRRPQEVLGRNFFRDVAPCTAVRAFEGVLKRRKREGKNAREQLEFAFTFRDETKFVEIMLLHHASTGFSTILVKEVTP